MELFISLLLFKTFHIFCFKNTVFFDVENSQLKLLNDTLKEKNFVTSLTNYHKELTFKKMQELVKKNPGLQMDMYSDFKSSRFAFLYSNLNTLLITSETTKKST